MKITLFEQRPSVWRLRIRRHGLRDTNRWVHGDRAAAEAAAAAWAREVAQEGLPGAIDASQPFGRWVRDHIARQSHLTEVTRAWYRGLVDRYIDPPLDSGAPRAAFGPVDPDFRLGRRQLRLITASDGLTWQRWMLDANDGRHRSQYAAWHLARAALGEAVAVGALPKHPWAALKKRELRRPERRVPTRSELRRVSAIAVEKPTLQLLLDLALATGARRGELLALRWRDIDLAAPSVTIIGSLEQHAGQLRIKPPKTPAGRRTISLPPAAVDQLRTARAAAAVAALAQGYGLDEQPVLPGPDGSWWSPAAASQAARRALHHAGIQGSVHSLRHAHATTLLSEKISPKAVQHRLGHSSAQVTMNIYAHAVPEDDAAAAAAITRTLRKLA